MKGVIIILGSPNDDKGNLMQMAVDRIDKGIEEYNKRPGYKIIVTGGFGKHFNTTDKPHAHYAKQYLVEKGVAEHDILALVESRFTMEDATLSKPVADQYRAKALVIVSSDFHIPRVSYIFRHVFRGYHLSYSEVPTHCSPEQYHKLLQHEAEALDKMKRDGFTGY